MIDELHVENVALIREASIEPADGLTVLTGETGAGKTALLSAIKLLCGERADAGAVREGAPRLVVEAQVFLDDEDQEGCVVTRTVEASGRGRVRMDGRLASVRELAQRVGTTIDLCGQHEHQRLLDPTTHVSMLDAWAGEDVAAARHSYGEALAAARAAARELERVSALGREAGERLDEAQFVLRRIDEVGPSQEEYEELEEALPRAEHAEALMRAAEEARMCLADENGAIDAISEASSSLVSASRHDAKLGRYADTLETLLIDLEDVASELRSYRDEVDLDPNELARMSERMGAYHGLLRTYGPKVSDVLERRAQAAEVVSAAQDGGELERQARIALERAEAVLAKRADALDELRRKAVPSLVEALREQMALLELGTASVDVEFERLPRTRWAAQGPSRVEFLYRPAEGMTPRPLRKIASGGEISRVMLAAKVVLGERDDANTLVFDEVDAGVGGATAVALAQVLAKLAQTHQVIVVTHLAQVAVVAQRHYLVEKSAGEGAVPETLLREIGGEERVAEVARMLSGDTGEASLAHARALLGDVSQPTLPGL